MKPLKSYAHICSQAAVGSLKEVDSLTLTEQDVEIAMAHPRVLVIAEAQEEVALVTKLMGLLE